MVGSFTNIIFDHILNRICQVTERTALPEDPAKDPNFEEPMIDQVRAQKDEDLERYRREIERRSRQWGDYFDQSVKYQMYR